MAAKVKVSQDGNISFTASENVPTTPKKFRNSQEIAAFYRFIYEHDLQKEASEIIEKHWVLRLEQKAEAKAAKKAAKKAEKLAAKKAPAKKAKAKKKK